MRLINSLNIKQGQPIYHYSHMVLVTQHLEYCAHFWAPQYEEGIVTECVEQRAAVMVKNMVYKQKIYLNH